MWEGVDYAWLKRRGMEKVGSGESEGRKEAVLPRSKCPWRTPEPHGPSETAWRDWAMDALPTQRASCLSPGIWLSPRPQTGRLLDENGWEAARARLARKACVLFIDYGARRRLAIVWVIYNMHALSAHKRLRWPCVSRARRRGGRRRGPAGAFRNVR